MTRPPSHLAHGPADVCPACTDCPSCQGGAASIPDQYRVVKRATPHAGIALAAACTRCHGTGTVCPNLLPHQRQESA